MAEASALGAGAAAANYVTANTLYIRRKIKMMPDLCERQGASYGRLQDAIEKHERYRTENQHEYRHNSNESASRRVSDARNVLDREVQRKQKAEALSDYDESHGKMKRGWRKFRYNQYDTMRSINALDAEVQVLETGQKHHLDRVKARVEAEDRRAAIRQPIVNEELAIQNYNERDYRQDTYRDPPLRQPYYSPAPRGGAWSLRSDHSTQVNADEFSDDSHETHGSRYPSRSSKRQPYYSPAPRGGARSLRSDHSTLVNADEFSDDSHETYGSRYSSRSSKRYYEEDDYYNKPHGHAVY